VVEEADAFARMFDDPVFHRSRKGTSMTAAANRSPRLAATMAKARLPATSPVQSPRLSPVTFQSQTSPQHARVLPAATSLCSGT
jgi:hypothetical protein